MGPGIYLKLYVQGINTGNAENSGMLRLSRMNLFQSLENCPVIDLLHMKWFFFARQYQMSSKDIIIFMESSDGKLSSRGKMVGQEEPKNMGAWTYVQPRLATAVRELCSHREFTELHFIGRATSATTATGSFQVHQQETRAIIDSAFSA
jgi:hypothetical protein